MNNENLERLRLAVQAHDVAHYWYDQKEVNVVAVGCPSCEGTGYDPSRYGLHPNDGDRDCRCVVDARGKACKELLSAARAALPPNAELNGARRASDLSAELGAGD